MWVTNRDPLEQNPDRVYGKDERFVRGRIEPLNLRIYLPKDMVLEARAYEKGTLGAKVAFGSRHEPWVVEFFKSEEAEALQGVEDPLRIKRLK